MGRPPLRKKGPFTPAERQRRRRAKLKREHRQVERKEMARLNFERYQDHAPPVWLQALSLPLPDPADEIARQIADMLQVERNLTIDDVINALHRIQATGRPAGDPSRRQATK